MSLTLPLMKRTETYTTGLRNPYDFVWILTVFRNDYELTWFGLWNYGQFLC